MDFTQWFVMQTRGTPYTCTHTQYQDDCDWMSFNGKFGVVYVKRPITVDVIKGFFSSHNNPILFVVDATLIDAQAMDEPWLRAIHALYYGRVYAWVGDGIMSTHYDRINRVVTTWGPVNVSNVYFDTVDSWYKGMPGVYETARFNDPNFWKADEPKQRREHKKKMPNDTEQFWREEFERQKRANPSSGSHEYGSSRAEDVYEAFREAFNGYKRQYVDENPPRPPRATYRPNGDKWFELLMAEGTLDGAKKKYRQLALENHPDRMGDSPEVVQTMQLINMAYARVKEILT